MPIDRLAYAALVYAADTEAKARAGAEKLMWYMTANKVPPHFAYPPGYLPVPAAMRIMRGAALDQHAALKSRLMVDFGHLLIMGQAGFLEHDDTVAGIRTFAREVYPRLKEEFPDTAISGVRQERVVA